MSYRQEPPASWGEIIILFLFAGLLMVGLWACQKSDREDCEANGGVWLTRESACVSGPQGGNR